MFHLFSVAVKEAAVQRRHNLYRDSIVLSNSDPSLHLLGENPTIDWTGEYGGASKGSDGPVEDAEGDGESAESQQRTRMKQVVSMIQAEGFTVLPSESCVETPSTDVILEEADRNDEKSLDKKGFSDECGSERPQMSVNFTDVSKSSVMKEEEVKPGDQCKDFPLEVNQAAESTAIIAEEVKQDNQPVVKKQPSSIQTESEETLQLPPFAEEIPSEATEKTQNPAEATLDFPVAPHDDSGFQSPTSEEVEVEKTASCVSQVQPSEDGSVERRAHVAEEPGSENTHTETRKQ